jgi:hypothetical protein
MALLPTGVPAENVCLSGKTRSNRRGVKATRLTQSGGPQLFTELTIPIISEGRLRRVSRPIE